MVVTLRATKGSALSHAETDANFTSESIGEPKGAAAASANEVYLADGASSGSFQPAWPHGGTSIAGNATATTIGVAGTFVLPGLTFTAGGSPSGVTETALNGRLTYTGTADRHFHIVSNFDMTCASNSQVISFQWHKDGAPIGVAVDRKVGTGSDVGAASLHTDAHLSTGEYIELWLTNDTSTASVTLGNVYMFMMGMPG